jgi:hypothetical protein
VVIGLLRGQTLQLATTRTYWMLAAGALALIAAGTSAATATSFTPGTGPARTTLATAGLAQTVALLAGALSVTSEFRHKTITPAVLISPGRTPLLAAKLITMTAAGLAFGLTATGMATAITLPLLAARHIPAGISGTQAAAIITGGGVATALAAALGVSAGTIIRNQAGTIITVLALLYIAEPLLGFIPHAGTAVQKYGLGGLAAAATRTAGFPATAHLPGQGPALLVLAAYTTAVLLTAAALLRHRDITT